MRRTCARVARAGCVIFAGNTGGLKHNGPDGDALCVVRYAYAGFGQTPALDASESCFMQIIMKFGWLAQRTNRHDALCGPRYTFLRSDFGKTPGAQMKSEIDTMRHLACFTHFVDFWGRLGARINGTDTLYVVRFCGLISGITSSVRIDPTPHILYVWADFGGAQLAPGRGALQALGLSAALRWTR
jgi:hypothetical protein